MIFKNSDQIIMFLWLIPALIAVVFGYQRRMYVLKKTINQSLWSQIVPGLSRGRRIWKYILILAVLLCVIVAILRPQYGARFEKIERKGNDIYIALDLSNSMFAQDIKPSRLVHAKREILGLLDELKGDRIGLISFAGEAFIQCPLTFDYAALTMYLDFMQPELMPVPGTDIATAIKKARLSFKKTSQDQNKILILLTDGESFENDPLASAKVAAEQGVTIYTIGIGSPKGEPIPMYNENNKLTGYKKDKDQQIILSKLNENELMQIAAVTNGQYFNSSLGSFVMDKVYQDISASETARLEESLLKINIDRYQWFLALALLFLIIDTLLSEHKKVKES